MCRRCCVLGELLADAGFCFAKAEALGIGDAGEVVVLEFFAADAVACGAFAADGPSEVSMVSMWRSRV